jgi:prolipoprotein diacylglyceryltransferase
MAAEMAVILLMVLIWLLVMALIVVSLVFWIWMIIDCAQRKMKDNDKVVWILILIFLGSIGAAIYYFVVKRKA